jgi:benzoyl-CoA reductase subunit B
MNSDSLELPALEATSIARDYQKTWFTTFRTEVLEQRKPYVIADAVTPHEIFHVMDIPVVSMQWYSSIIAAKQLAPHYFALMDELGYHDGLPRYSSLPFFSTLENDPQIAPYGGLPKPMLLLERLRGDYAQRIIEKWSKAFDVPYFVLDSSASTRLQDLWYERGMRDWEDLYESHRLDFQSAQLDSLIRLAETLSGREFDEAEFARQMHRINQAGEIVAEVRDLLAKADRSPVPLPEQLSVVMAATWHRGSEWSIKLLERYRDEIAQRVNQNQGFCKNEGTRLLWLNNGLWFNTNFYRAFEESHGAVFVWSMYSDFLSAGYRKYFDGDPIRALAARHISMNEQLHLPGWMSEWIIDEAKAFGAHGAVMLVPSGDRLSAYGTRLTQIALEEAGLPVLALEANMVDSRLWDDSAMTAQVSQFLNTRVRKDPFQ